MPDSATVKEPQYADWVEDLKSLNYPKGFRSALPLLIFPTEEKLAGVGGTDISFWMSWLGHEGVESGKVRVESFYEFDEKYFHVSGRFLELNSSFDALVPRRKLVAGVGMILIRKHQESN